MRSAGNPSVGASRPLGPNDEFRIGSITKTFTATAVLQLVDQHKLSLDSPLSKWEPRVQHASRSTVKMLLTSGIFDEPAGPTLVKQLAAHPGKAFTAQQLVNMAIAHGPHSPPGRLYYSNTTT